MDDGCIMIVGVGALGCEIAKDFALMGVGKLILIDLDTIEPIRRIETNMHVGPEASNIGFDKYVADDNFDDNLLRRYHGA